MSNHFRVFTFDFDLGFCFFFLQKPAFILQHFVERILKSGTKDKQGFATHENKRVHSFRYLVLVVDRQRSRGVGSKSTDEKFI